MDKFNRRQSRAQALRTALFGALALISSGALAQAPASPSAPAAVAPDQLPTPRDAAGHPVLAGMWNGTAPNAGGGLGGIVGVACISDRPNCKPSDFIDFQSRTGTWLGYEEDNRINRRNGTNKPLYRPEFWDVVQDNDTWANWRDPVNFCLPYGVPRSGAPTQILQIADEPMVELIYSKTFHTFNMYRLLPTDGRPHNAAQVALETYAGDAVGHWEGDTLVIDTIGFTDNTWLGADGWIHGYQMKVTERATRKGNTLRWETTVDDPEYFQQPWSMGATTLYLNTDETAFLPEAWPCDSRIREPWGTEDKPTGSPVH